MLLKSWGTPSEPRGLEELCCRGYPAGAMLQGLCCKDYAAGAVLLSRWSAHNAVAF